MTGNRKEAEESLRPSRDTTEATGEEAAEPLQGGLVRFRCRYPLTETAAVLDSPT
jgi:hypothetical protein